MALLCTPSQKILIIQKRVVFYEIFHEIIYVLLHPFFSFRDHFMYTFVLISICAELYLCERKHKPVKVLTVFICKFCWLSNSCYYFFFALFTSFPSFYMCCMQIRASNVEIIGSPTLMWTFLQPCPCKCLMFRMINSIYLLKC